MTMEPKNLTIIFPYSDLQNILAGYLKHAGAIADNQMVTGIEIPVEINDEDMIEARVHVLEDYKEGMN